MNDRFIMMDRAGLLVDDRFIMMDRAGLLVDDQFLMIISRFLIERKRKEKKNTGRTDCGLLYIRYE